MNISKVNTVYEYKDTNFTEKYFIKQSDNYFYFIITEDFNNIVLYVRDEGKNIWEKYRLVSTEFGYNRRLEIIEFIHKYRRNKK